MHIEVSAEHGIVIEDTKAGKNAHKAQRTVKRLIDQLCSSICAHVNFLSDYNSNLKQNLFAGSIFGADPLFVQSKIYSPLQAFYYAQFLRM